MTKEIHDINTRALDFVVELIEYIFEYPNDDYMTMECLCRKLVKHGLLDKADGYYQTHEIRTNTHECVKTNADQHVQRVEYVGNDERSRCWKCKYFERMHETPISSDGSYYTYVVCTASKCHYEPKTEPNLSEIPNGSDEPQIIVCPIIDDDAWIYEDECKNCREGQEHDCYGCPFVKQDEPQTEREGE